MNSVDLKVDSVKISDDLWLLSRNHSSIAFSPLSRMAFEVKPKGVKALYDHFGGNHNLTVENFLSTNGFYNKFPINTTDKNEPFSPEGVVLSLTSGCNLRCIYCYADAGSNIVTMKEETGKLAIDYAMENAKNSRKAKSRVFFHGGGEALFVWPLLRNLTEYAAKRWGDMVRFSAVTNATLITPSRADWLSKHKYRLTVSLDGPKIVQDYQRPSINSKSSFDLCYEGLNLLKDRGVEFGIRATITKISAEYIEDLVKIAREFDCGIKLEPFTAVGRGSSCESQLNIHPNDFVKAFLRAEKLGNELGIKVTTTYLKIDAPGERFCAGNGSMFLVTPTGDISSCSRSTQLGDVFSDIFFIGKIDNNGIFIDNQKVKALRQLRPDNFDECKDCFGKLYCRGGCHNTRINYGGKAQEDHCTMARWFIWLNLFRNIYSITKDGVLY